MIHIQEIPFGSVFYELSLHFREEILRFPLGLVMTEQDVQGEEQQMHVAAVESDRIMGIVLMKPLASQIVKLRQMAVAPSLQGRGTGRDLVIYAEKLAAERGFQMVETHARVSAQGFYKKLGYQPVGEVFTEVTIPAIKMTKNLT